MALVVQGDHKVPILFTIPLNLTQSTVEVLIRQGNTLVKKDATILDAVKGRCQFTLEEEDLLLPGTYQYQWTVRYVSGRVQSGIPQYLPVNERLSGNPPTIEVKMDGGRF